MARGGSGAIGVLVVEDSPVQRQLLCHVLSTDPAISVIGIARDGVEAVAQASALKPDVIVMDVNMPAMNGYEATRQILAETPTPIVLVTAGFTADEVQRSFAAIEAGALSIIGKPAGLDDPGHAASAAHLVRTVKLISEVTVVRRGRRQQRSASAAPPLPLGDRRVRVVAIAASTGGPNVIADILSRLSGTLNAAVLVVQHMATGFMPGFAAWLEKKTGLPTGLARAGEAIVPGRVYLAPDGKQMGVDGAGRIALSSESGGNGFCPSGSWLLASVGDRYGLEAIGIVLTGMGNDGAEGLLRLRRAGGIAIVQDAESCVVSGMPSEAIALGAAEHVLAPEAIATIVRQLTS